MAIVESASDGSFELPATRTTRWATGDTVVAAVAAHAVAQGIDDFRGALQLKRLAAALRREDQPGRSSERRNGRLRELRGEERQPVGKYLGYASIKRPAIGDQVNAVLLAGFEWS